MARVCLVNLVGLPASGKTTFCHRFCEQFRSADSSCNVVHIEYDKLVKIPMDTQLRDYLESKSFKAERFRLRWLIREIIGEIKRYGSIKNTLNLVRIEYAGCELTSLAHVNVTDFIILVDDNMYYSSMRKETRSIAKENGIGYLVVYFEISAASAITRNAHREIEKRVDDDHILSMANRFEIPTENEGGNIICVNNEKEQLIDLQAIQLAIVDCMQNPLRLEPIAPHLVVEQSDIHRIDLILRKEISKLMQRATKNTDKKALSEILCQKRKHILSDLRSGILDVSEDSTRFKSLLSSSKSND